MRAVAVLTTYVEKRLVAIQARHNFDPAGGARQVAGHPVEIVAAYGRFRELLGVVDKLALCVRVPFDPSGLRPVARRAVREAAPVCVYFARRDRTTVWKIGSSITPATRVKAVATGNDGPIRLRYEVVYPTPTDGRVMERRLKRHFQAYKTRDRHSSIKGEWFDLPQQIVIDTIQRLKTGDTFVGVKPLRRERSG